MGQIKQSFAKLYDSFGPTVSLRTARSDDLSLGSTLCRKLSAEMRRKLGEWIQVVLLILLALTSGVAILLGLMVVGLLEAPWPILMSSLFLGLFGLQRLAANAIEWDSDLEASETQVSQEKARSVPPESPADDSSTFTYRGVKYRSPSSTKPTVEEQPTITEGIYRGQPWRRSSADTSKQAPPSSEQPPELKYRGHKVNHDAVP